MESGKFSKVNPGLVGLYWVIDNQHPSSDGVERSYALTVDYVYRRERHVTEDIRPKYYRALPQDVLDNENCWGDVDTEIWVPVNEMGDLI